MQIRDIGTPTHPSQLSHSLLFSTAPAAIQGLVICSENPPHLVLPVEELDALIMGKTNTEELESAIASGCYMDQILPSIDWWIEIMKALSCGGSDPDDVEFQPAFEKRKAKLLELLNATLAGYAAALAEDSYFSGRDSTRAPAAIELLKLYRLYTSAVCSLACEIYPQADLQWLLKQP
jgi:hypothetical protein